MTKIVIVGAGIIGATIAYELSLNSHFEVTLVEQETSPALHSTGASLGVLMGFLSGKLKGKAWQLRQKSLERYETLIPELERLTGEKISYNCQGIVKLLFPDDSLSHWSQFIAVRNNQGGNLELWEAEELRQHCPQVTRSDVIAGLYSPCDRQVNPKELTEVLLKGANLNGVKTLFGVKVEKIKIKGDGDQNNYNCDYILTSQGKIETDWLILANGLGVKELTEQLKKPLDLRPVLGQGLQLKVEGNMGQFQPVITGNDVHIVPLKNNEYWLGATVEFPDENGDLKVNENLLEEIKNTAFSYCSILKNSTIIKKWYGKRPRPEGRPAPIIEKLRGSENILLATGHYRNGLLLAPATASIIKDFLFD